MRNPDETRHRLLMAAAEELVSLGIGGIRVDRLAARAGVNKRMIYHYFGNKDGLCAWALSAQIDILERYDLGSGQISGAAEPDDGRAPAPRLRGMLAPLLPAEKFPTGGVPTPSMPDSLDAVVLSKAALIVLRALVDLRGATPDYRLPSDGNGDWPRVMPWLCDLANPAEASRRVSVSAPPTKQRLSLRPVISPL